MSLKQLLPEKRCSLSTGADEVCHIKVKLQLVTPVLGGSAKTRQIDEIDYIRSATVRGCMRFWWRALYGHKYDTPQQLYDEESARWGRAADDHGGRSKIEIKIDVDRRRLGVRDEIDIDLQRTPGAYALWPARAEKGSQNPPAPRRKPGTQFELSIYAPKEFETEVKNCIRAWIIFGGYGSRSRRGLGSLTVVDSKSDFLPASAERTAFEKLFGFDIFQAIAKAPTDVPILAGASLYIEDDPRQPEEAWCKALNWLRDFRQGSSGESGERAREPAKDVDRFRPSISNWPEADKIRWIKRKTRDHKPQYEDQTPAWPRAGFGLPILGQFQTKARGGSGRLDEPGPFELKWRDKSTKEERDRLASPLILKAIPLANGTFVPCALWLNRAYPSGEVFLKGEPGSGAPFDRLLGPKDVARFSPLKKASLKEAFFSWLGRTANKGKVIAP